MKLLFIVNSTIAKKGNIGFRFGKIIAYLETKSVSLTCVSRDSKYQGRSKVINFAFFSWIQRGLNAFRMYVSPAFNHRRYDIYIFELCVLFTLRIILRKEMFSVVHILEYSPSIIRVLKKYGCRVILEVPIAPNSYVTDLRKQYGSTFGLRENIYMQRKEMKSFLLADAIVVPSSFVFQELVKNGVDRQKIHVVPFGGLGQVKVRAREPRKRLRFLFVGEVNERKGVRYLLDAWKELDKEGHELVLCGRVGRALKTYASALKLVNVHFKGYVEVEQYYEDADVYVFPSLLEGSSKSIFEALSYGLPVITTLESGSIVTNGCEGIIVPKCNVQKLQEAMSRLIEDSRLLKRMSDEAQKTIRNYTWEKYSEQMLGVYLSQYEDAL